MERIDKHSVTEETLEEPTPPPLPPSSYSKALPDGRDRSKKKKKIFLKKKKKFCSSLVNKSGTYIQWALFCLLFHTVQRVVNVFFYRRRKSAGWGVCGCVCPILSSCYLFYSASEKKKLIPATEREGGRRAE